jgi:asparagine synthase (glutamine-hydrolysing)
MAQLLRPDLDPVAQVSYAELNGYLRNTLLRDSDAMSMAHGLEIRPVLLDHELVELAFSLPAKYKSAPGRPKRILVDAVADLLPPEIGTRRKMGFELPYGSWLQGPLRERALDLLQSSPAGQLFSSSFVAVLAAELHGGKARAHRLWSVIMLLAFLDVHQLSVEVDGWRGA